MNTPTTPSRPLRIAVLNRHFGKRFGGAEHYSVAVVERLALEHEIHVFAQEIEHQMPGVHYHRISRPLSKPRWVNQLWYATATWWHTRHGFDIVHSHENTWHGNIQTIHVRPFRMGLFHQRTGLRRWLKWLNLFTSPRLMTYWWLERARMQPNRCIVATSETLKQEILQTYPHAAPMLHTIPPGVNLPPVPQDRVHLQTEMRTVLGLPQNVTLALFVGNDYIKKGLPTLLQALVDLPKVHLAVVGRPTHQASCQQLADSLGLTTRVHFLGSLPDVAPAYGAADLLVHPTTEDTYAMVVLEAMAHSLPVIVSGSAYCGITQELTDGKNALILDNPRDSTRLSQLIEEILPKSQFLTDAGHVFAARRTWDATAQYYAQLNSRAALANSSGVGSTKQRRQDTK